MEDLEALRQKVLKYQLRKAEKGAEGYTRILLQLFGSAGHGKSSLINSCKYVLEGTKFETPAQVASGHQSQGGLTTCRTTYVLTDTITMVDNRGFGKMDSYETEEIYAQLANILPLDETVSWNKPFADIAKSCLMNSEMTYTDLVVPLYVYSAEEGLDKSRAEEIKTFLTNAQRMTGFLPIVVITKTSCEKVQQVHQQFQNIGIESIFKVENYTPNNNSKTLGKDKQFLLILTEVLSLVDFRMEQHIDLKVEHNKRLQDLVIMANDREVKKAIEDTIRKMEKEQQNKKPEKKAWCTLS